MTDHAAGWTPDNVLSGHSPSGWVPPAWWPSHEPHGAQGARVPGTQGARVPGTGRPDGQDRPAAYYGFLLTGKLDAPLFKGAVRQTLARYGVAANSAPIRSECAEHADGLAWLLGLPIGTAAGPDVGQLCAEVTAAYQILLAGHGLAEFSSPSNGAGEAADLRYWQRVLAGAPAVLDLPADRLRPPGGSLLAGSLSLALPGQQQAAGQQQAFDRLLAAVAVLLYRMTGDGDVVLGARPASATGGHGPAGPLPVRVPVSGDQRFCELQRQVRQARSGAIAHDAVGIARIAAELRSGHQVGYHPVFQVLVEDQQALTTSLRLPGIRVSLLPQAGRWSPYDLHLSAALTEPASADLRYSADLFDHATAEQLAQALSCVLHSATDRPDTRVDDLPLLSGTRRDEVIRLNRTAIADLRPVTLCRPANPEQIAIIDAERGRLVSYAELHERAELLAGLLRSSGVRPGSTVGLYLPRSADAIAAIFAVLRLGAAYLPLDADHPPARIRQAITEAKPHTVVTSSQLAAGLAPVDVPLIRCDAHGQTANGHSANGQTANGQTANGQTANGRTENSHGGNGRTAHERGTSDGDRRFAEAGPQPPIHLDSVAYVMYTSGSTGRPRAVQVLHRGLAGYVRAAIDRYQLGPDDRVLQFTSLGFDVSAEEMFPCLAVGGTLVLRSAAMIASPQDFLAGLTDHGVTAMHLPASYFHELAAQLPASAMLPPPSLRLVVVGGEPVVPAHARRWLDWTGSGTRLVNVYGITETTIVTTIADLTPQITPDASVPGHDQPGADGPVTGQSRAGTAGRLPIGRPIEGSDVFVLDEQLRPVPPGFPAEICIAGAGLARGYLGRAAATAQRFVPHPFADGERLYRSGDIGRMRSDGTLECLGRIDRQVKLHGYRIELGEVEAALCRIGQVDEAAVTVRPDRLGRDCLVAHVTLASQLPVSPDQLRTDVAAILPHYMVPNAIVLLDVMPHSAHDKIDYRALPDPGAPADSPEPLTDPVEQTVAEAWRQVLDLAAVGSQDNFFELGGHSLSAMAVTTKLREVFGPQLAVAVLFEHPRLADFATAAVAFSGPADGS